MIIGILITLSMIYGVGFTNGGLAVWTLNEMLPFALPELIGSITVPNIVAVMAFYK